MTSYYVPYKVVYVTFPMSNESIEKCENYYVDIFGRKTVVEYNNTENKYFGIIELDIICAN